MFKEIIQGLGKGNKERKEKFKDLDEQDRLQTMIEERKKPSNERELEKFMEKERQKKITEALTHYRKKEQEDINFNYNPINTKNITNKSGNLLKEKKLFSDNKNMFSNQKNIFSNGNLGLCR